MSNVFRFGRSMLLLEGVNEEHTQNYGIRITRLTEPLPIGNIGKRDELSSIINKNTPECVLIFENEEGISTLINMLEHARIVITEGGDTL